MNLKLILSEVSFISMRSSGPGGQNVNKVSSAVQLYWDYSASYVVNQEQKDLIRIKLKNMINKEDQVYIRCEEFRDLEQNKKRALEKLLIAVEKALHKAKVRKPSKPTYSSKMKKLDSKKKRSVIKQNRKKLSYD